jgi:Protein of unknown function (DUF1217)
MSSSLSYLTTLFSNSFGAGDPMLNAIYGLGTSSAGSTNPVLALQSAEKNQTQDVASTAAQPAVQVAMKAFTQAVSSATSVDQLLSNPAFMNVFMTANNMSDQSSYTALAKQALTSNLSDPNSLANQLTDTRWKTVAQTYNLSSPGALASLQSPATMASLANAYATATWEASEDKVTPGLSNALAFKAQASTITTVDGVLGNPTVRNVVTTALGIPEQIAFQTIGAQEKAISSQLDVTQFQNPAFVETFAQRYLIANAAAVAATAAATAAASSSSSSPDITSLAIQGQGILA